MKQLLAFKIIAIKGMFESFLLFSLPTLKRMPFFLTWLKKSMLQCECNIQIVALTYFYAPKGTLGGI